MEGEPYYGLVTKNPSLVLLTLLCIFLGLFKLIAIPYLQSKRPYERIPTCPNAHWLLGHLHMSQGRNSFPESFLYVYRDNADENGRTGFWQIRMPAISIVNIADARHLLKMEFWRNRSPIVSHYIAQVIGEKNLLFLNGKEWRTNRAAVTMTFVHAFLLQSRQDVYEVAQDLIRTFQTNIDSSTEGAIELDVLPVMKMVTSDVVGKAAFNTNFDCCKSLTHSPVVSAFEYIMNDVEKRTQNPMAPWNYFFWLPLRKNRLFKEQVSVLRDYIESLLQEARQKELKQIDKPGSTVEKSELPKLSLIDRLVAANDSSDTVSSDQVLIDVVSTLLIASYDTTSTTLAFAFYLLANHPDMQDQCFEEVKAVAKTCQKLTNPDPLVYCTSLVKESLRLYPPAAVVGRTTTKAIPLPSDGFVIPKGSRCMIPIFAIHRDERIFPRALECRPERWCQFDSTNNKWTPRDYQSAQPETQLLSARDTIPAGNPDAWIPFSVGARQCPGRNFALQEVTLVLANMVQAFQILPVPGYKLKLCLKGPLPFPEHGMPLRFEKR